MNSANGNTNKPLWVKQIKDIIGPRTKIWIAACNDYNWSLRDPFIGVSDKYSELSDRARQELEGQIVFRGDQETEEDSRLEVFLCEE
jgi:integrase